MSYYDEITCRIDEDQTERFIGGSRGQHVSVILTDESDCPLEPALVTVRPYRAREVAIELIRLAEAAERKGLSR